MKDIMGMMKAAGEMKGKMEAMQAELAELVVEGRSGGGMVVVSLSGKGDLRGVKIDPSLFKDDDVEVLEDLIVAAHADAKRRLDEVNGALMREAAGPMAGLNIPGMPKLF